MEKPIQKIRRLQNSIDKKKIHIQHIKNQRNRQIRFLDDIMQKTIPKLKSLIKQSIIYQNKSRNLSQSSTQSHLCNSNQFINARSRITPQERSRVKEEIQNKKIKDYSQIKEQSKYNYKLISQKKLKQLKLKQQKKSLIRMSECKSKQSIKTFYEQKKIYIRQKKQQQIVEASNRASILATKLKQLENQHEKICRVRKESSENIQIFRKTLQSIQNQKKSKICDISERIGVYPNDKMEVKDLKRFFGEIYLGKENIK